MVKMVRVLRGEDGRICRIFRNDKKYLDFPSCQVYTVTKSEAVKDLREQVYERSGHECERCGRAITWVSMEMHEKIHRGKGGEQSLENCVALCHNCHTGDADSEHGNRRWKTARLGLND